MFMSDIRTEAIEEKMKARGLWPVAVDVAKTHYVTTDQLLGRSKTKSIATARKGLYRALREKNLSTPEIGDILERHHITVLRGARPLENLDVAAAE